MTHMPEQLPYRRCFGMLTLWISAPYPQKGSQHVLGWCSLGGGKLTSLDKLWNKLLVLSRNEGMNPVKHPLWFLPREFPGLFPHSLLFRTRKTNWLNWLCELKPDRGKHRNCSRPHVPWSNSSSALGQQSLLAHLLSLLACWCFVVVSIYPTTSQSFGGGSGIGQPRLLQWPWCPQAGRRNLGRHPDAAAAHDQHPQGHLLGLPFCSLPRHWVTGVVAPGRRE